MSGIEENTRIDLIDSAAELFQQKGFEETSIDDICEKVGVSHGLFYYYFDSKEEVIEAITENMVDEIEGKLKEIVEDEDLKADEKFLEFMKISFQKKKGKPYIYSFFSEEKNLKIYQHLYAESVEMMTPYLTNIVQQGIEEGIFDTEHPEETVRFWLHGLKFSRGKDGFFRDDPWKDFKALSSITERLLGTEREFITSFFDGYEEEIKHLIKKTRRDS